MGHVVGGRPHGARPEGLPARQGRVAGVGEEKWPRRRFDVAVAKDHVGYALVTAHFFAGI